MSEKEASLSHHGVKGMRWGVRKNVKVFGTEQATDKKISRAQKKGKSVIVGSDKKTAKKQAESVETLIRANEKLSYKNVRIEMDRQAHSASVGAMTASYIRSGVTPSKAQAKSLKKTKDAKVRKDLLRRTEKAEKWALKINERMKAKYSEAELQVAQSHLDRRTQTRKGQISG